MARTEIKVKVINSYGYEAPAFTYGYETHYIHTFKDEDGKVYVWKTTKSLMIEKPYTGKKGHHNFEDRNGNPVEYSAINKGSVIRIAATVKGESEYKGQPQTVINRVKVLEVIEASLSKEEWIQKKAEEQLASLNENDCVLEMPYRQYKNHYSDCEAVAGSYTEYLDSKGYFIQSPTIKVIIREGRMKNSGTRGKRFNYFVITYEVNGEEIIDDFKAINEENAIKQLMKEEPEAVITKILQC